MLKLREPHILGDNDVIEFGEPYLVALDGARRIREAEVDPSEGTGTKMLADDRVAS